MRCRVKPGKQLAHAGEVLEVGQEVELPIHIALEVPHLVEEVLPTGETRPIGQAPDLDLQERLARHRPHKRITLLEQARERAAADLSAIEGQIASERKRLEAEQKAAAPKAPPAPATPAQKE